jgi:hypothetical protein
MKAIYILNKTNFFFILIINFFLVFLSKYTIFKKYKDSYFVLLFFLFYNEKIDVYLTNFTYLIKNKHILLLIFFTFN